MLLEHELEILSEMECLHMACGCISLRGLAVTEIVEHARKGDGVDYFFRLGPSDVRRRMSPANRASATQGAIHQPRCHSGAAEGGKKGENFNEKNENEISRTSELHSTSTLAVT